MRRTVPKAAVAAGLEEGVEGVLFYSLPPV